MTRLSKLIRDNKTSDSTSVRAACACFILNMLIKAVRLTKVNKIRHSSKRYEKFPCLTSFFLPLPLGLNGNGWMNQQEMLAVMGYKKWGTHIINASSTWLRIQMQWIERIFLPWVDANGQVKSIAYFRATVAGMAHDDLRKVRERKQEQIMLYFNDPVNANRNDITRQEVATSLGYSGVLSKVFVASFKDLIHQGRIQNGNGRGRYQLV